jgi:hypothetical protein
MKVEGYVARCELGRLVFSMSPLKRTYNEKTIPVVGIWEAEDGSKVKGIDSTEFANLKWEDDPIKTEILI